MPNSDFILDRVPCGVSMAVALWIVLEESTLLKNCIESIMTLGIDVPICLGRESVLGQDHQGFGS